MRMAVQQAILSMRSRYHDRITLPDIASEVYVSPFHFSRMFAQDTGVTPGRFLTSIRLFEAKRLLVTTSMTVSDVVCSVGYSSVGTFTKRFTQSVGLTPAQYREPEVGALLVAAAPEFYQVPPPARLHRAGARRLCAAHGCSVVASVRMPLAAGPVNILVGVYGCPIPQAGPVAYAAAWRSGSTDVVLDDVPAGEWTLIAVAEPADGTDAGGPYVGVSRVPGAVTAGRASRVLLRMRPVTAVDPPIAVTLASRVTSDGIREDARPGLELRAAA